MDKKLIKELAKDFVREGDCFIHTEMKNGKQPETVLSGDLLGVAWGIAAEINRLSELTQTTFDETAQLIVMMHHETGYKNAWDMLGGEYKEIQGEDWQENWKAEETKRIEREVKNKDVDIANLKKKVKSLESIIRSQKENIEATRKEADKRVLEANKTVRKLEHEIRDLIERQKRE